MNTQVIISELKKILGENNIRLDRKSKIIYGKDFTQDFTSNPLAIVFPKNEEQIIKIVKLANTTSTGLVPSGGRTGYSGGAVAAHQEIVVSFEKLDRIIDFNATDKIITCEAGVTTKNIQNFAIQHNLFYPIDFASTETCHIGGNIATNAGGINVIRYGTTRNWVCGLKVITGNGELLEFNYGLKKNVTGYDLRHLFIGSEGTLGFIIESSLKLTNLPLNPNVILLSIPNKNLLSEILLAFSETLQINAFEFFSEEALHHVLAESNLPHPFQSASPFYILLEYESNKENDEIIKNTIHNCLHENIISNALTSKNKKQAQMFWRYRKEISLSLLKYSPYKYDIAVLSSRIPSFIKEVDALFSRIYPDFEIIWFGHLGDGNLHLNILNHKKLSRNKFFNYCKDMSKEVYSIIQIFKGTVSAEHGVGLLKKDFLHYSKSQVEIDYMRQIKKIFDKNNIMNPGKII